MRRDSASQDCQFPSCVTSDKTQPSLSPGDLIRDMHILTPAPRGQWEELVRSAGHRALLGNCWFPPRPGLILGGDKGFLFLALFSYFKLPTQEELESRSQEP